MKYRLFLWDSLLLVTSSLHLQTGVEAKTTSRGYDLWLCSQIDLDLNLIFNRYLTWMTIGKLISLGLICLICKMGMIIKTPTTYGFYKDRMRF